MPVVPAIDVHKTRLVWCNVRGFVAPYSSARADVVLVSEANGSAERRLSTTCVCVNVYDACVWFRASTPFAALPTKQAEAYCVHTFEYTDNVK